MSARRSNRPTDPDPNRPAGSPGGARRGFLAEVREALRRYLVTGILVFAPIAVTIWSIVWIFQKLDNILLPYRINPALTLDRAVRERAVELAGQVGIGDKLGRSGAACSANQNAFDIDAAHRFDPMAQSLADRHRFRSASQADPAGAGRSARASPRSPRRWPRRCPPG